MCIHIYLYIYPAKQAAAEEAKAAQVAQVRLIYLSIYLSLYVSIYLSISISTYASIHRVNG